MPSSKRQNLAVIGDPVAHSLSPLIQNAALKDLGLPLSYEKIHVTPNQLKKFVKEKAHHLLGFNITLPHKEQILKHLDYLVPQAKTIGAVNTVLNYKGKLVGFNTDGAGYLESLNADKHFNPKGKNIVLLGAGGATRALAASLALTGPRRIILANRTLKRAQQLVHRLQTYFLKVPFSYCGLKGKHFERALENADLLVNTTSVGLNNTQHPHFPWPHLNPLALVSDIVYTPIWTPFLKEARRLRHPVHTGEGMLVHQGALSLELWTSQRPKIELLKKVLMKKLRKS